MSRAVEKYLDCVIVYANRDREEAGQIRDEIEDHLLEKIADLQIEGLSYKSAVSKAIKDHGVSKRVGYRLRKRFPLVDIRTHGTARGCIAIGPKAVGVIAIGGAAFGFVAFGGLSFGFFGIGLVALAGFFSFGIVSAAFAGLANGVFALGLMAYGSFACGVTAAGKMAIGLLVMEGHQAISYFSYEAAPSSLRFLAELLTIGTEWGLYFYLTFYVVLIGLIATGMERRRIKKADLRLVG